MDILLTVYFVVMFIIYIIFRWDGAHPKDDITISIVWPFWMPFIVIDEIIDWIKERQNGAKP